MKIRHFLLTSSIVALLSWESGLAMSIPGAQDTPASGTTQSTDSGGEKQAATSSQNHRREKEKHWTGSLVDTSCMARAMSSTPGSVNQSTGRPDSGSTQHQLPQSSPETLPQTSRSSTPEMGAGQSSPRGGALPAGQYPDQNPDISQAQAAQMAQADKTDKEAKQCVATSATTAFGLVLSGGQLVRFDDEGNAKASEALKGATAQPGKRVKARVTGTLASGDIMKVASIELRGKHSSPAPVTQGGR